MDRLQAGFASKYDNMVQIYSFMETRCISRKFG